MPRFPDPNTDVTPFIAPDFMARIGNISRLKQDIVYRSDQGIKFIPYTLFIDKI